VTTPPSGQFGATGEVVETMIPRRLDRLPWSRWHWLVVVALGITWVLDGFEVTLVGAIASILTDEDALGLTTQQSASAGTFYLAEPLQISVRRLRESPPLRDHLCRVPSGPVQAFRHREGRAPLARDA
jgi:hypothetical protein